jgi:hypothetical protein
MTKYLNCPICGTPAVPSSGTQVDHEGREVPTWTEDDEARCPRCEILIFVRRDENGKLVPRYSDDEVDLLIGAAANEEGEKYFEPKIRKPR